VTTILNHTPLTQNPSIALVKTAAEGTGKVGDVSYFAVTILETQPY
jgi:hypothetical protein